MPERMTAEERARWRELLTRRPKPEDIRWMNEHAIVGHTIKSEHGTVMGCINFILVQTPEELEERKRHCQKVATRLYYEHLKKEARGAKNEARGAKNADVHH